MKRLAVALIALVAAPALAQQAATEIEHEGRGLMNSWIAAYNKGDVEAMAAIQATPDKVALEKSFADLRAESFASSMSTKPPSAERIPRTARQS